MTAHDEPDRLHIALHARDLARSIDFYEELFERPPAKRRDDYAKFELETPPLVLSLVPGPAPQGPGRLAHLGLRLGSQAALERARERLTARGLVSLDEGHTTCCYALQDKLWVSDPDGNAWELYRFLGDAAADASVSGGACPESSACCG